MRNVFVMTSNVKRFLAATGMVEERGAPEAGFMSVEGVPGVGKTRTASWFAVQQDAVWVRLKRAGTPHWFLTDVVRELGEVPAHTSEKLFGQAVVALATQPRPLVIDEAQWGFERGVAVIETVRDLMDIVEMPVVLVGRENISTDLKRHKQLWTRVSAVARFAPLTLEDVAKCCDELAEVPITEALAQRIADESDGLVRLVVTAIKNAERVGLRNKGEAVTDAMMKDEPLFQEWQKPRPRKVA